MGFQQGFRINTNTAALDTYRAYSTSQAGLEQNIERLSSGLRINKRPTIRPAWLSVNG